MSETETRVGIYARISEDTSGDELGVERQLHDARAMAEARGWDVVAEYTDNDISALRGQTRPGYRSMMAAAARGEIDQIVTFQTSRLWRNRRERAEGIEALADARVGIVAVKGPSIDLSTAYGRGMAGLLGEFDTMESEVKSERVAAAAAQRARDGLPNGYLGYGWTRPAKGQPYEVVEHEAAIVREIIDRLASRESLLAVTRDLNERGVPGPIVKKWGKTSVKKIALRYSNVSLRIHHRGRPTETVTEGNWPPLVDRAKWERVRAILAEPSRRTNTSVERPGARKHLLTWGIGECGVCRGYLRAALKGNASRGEKKLLYVCDSEGCTGRQAARVDELVRLVVLRRLQEPDALDWLRGDNEAAAAAGDEIERLTARKRDAAARFAAGKIDGDMMEAIVADLNPRIEDAKRRRDAAEGSDDLDLLRQLSGPRAAERWDEWGVTQRRAALAAMRLRVVIDRVKKRGPGFDPESVRFIWGGGQDAR